MLQKILDLVLGKQVTSSLVGIAGGAVTGAAGVAASGVMDKNALIAGAVIGAVAAVSGASGRATGEPR